MPWMYANALASLLTQLIQRVTSHQTHSKAPQMPSAQIDSQTPNGTTVKLAMKSAFYIGHVFHKRFFPKEHAFTYPLYMNFIDLDEVDLLNTKYWWFSSHRWAPLQLKISDYFSNEPTHTSELTANAGNFLKTNATWLINTASSILASANKGSMALAATCAVITLAN